ncbi:MAG: nucleotidyltransferase family protein [Patescibacteria group bacterium]
MQALILAAGKGTRMRPLTDDRPKPMVHLLGKPILAHAIECLPKEITEVVVVIGYHGEKIKEYFGSSYNERAISYVEQRENKGPAHALFTAREALTSDPFLLAAGDNVNVFSIPSYIHPGSYVLYVHSHQEPYRFGVVELTEDGKRVKNIEEKPESPASNLISTGTMILGKDVFNLSLTLHKERGEYFMPPVVMQAVSEGIPVSVEEQTLWIGVDSPGDIPVAELELARFLEKKGLGKNDA